MHSPSTQKSPHPQTPETSFIPLVKISQPNQITQSWREINWFIENEKDELAGYLFDSEILRE